MNSDGNFFVMVCQDKNVLIEADDIGEVIDVFELYHSDIDLNTEKFTILPITNIYYNGEEQDDKESNK